MISFREDFGSIWWPDYDHKPEKCFAFVQAAIADMDFAVSLAKTRKVCIQAGGHAGLWPLRLATYFERVLTFEPEPHLFQCLFRNTFSNEKILPNEAALGEFVGEVKLVPHVSAGSWRVDPAGSVPVAQVTIDSLRLDACDLILLDIEGYEVNALKGARDTIKQFNPVLHVEELRRSENAVSKYLSSIGYKLRRKMSRDLVFTRD